MTASHNTPKAQPVRHTAPSVRPVREDADSISGDDLDLLPQVDTEFTPVHIPGATPPPADGGIQTLAEDDPIHNGDADLPQYLWADPVGDVEGDDDDLDSDGAREWAGEGPLTR